MNINKKIVTFIILLIIIGGIFSIFNRKDTNTNTGDIGHQLEKNNKQTLRQGVIINMKDAEYEKLNEEEKGLLKNIFQNPKNEQIVSNEDLPSLFLKYYDDNIVITGMLLTKPSAPFFVFDRKKQVFLNADVNSVLYAKNLNYDLGYFENNQYMVSAYDNGIVYYKIGDDNIKVIPNSKLNTDQTYAKTNEMIDSYEISISTTTPKFLKVSIFKKDLTKEFNQKLREVEYVLQ